MSLSNTFKKYSSNLYRLHTLIKRGEGDADDAELLREVMDGEWNKLTISERKFSQNFSEFFSRVLDKPKTHDRPAELTPFIRAVVHQDLVTAFSLLPQTYYCNDWRAGVAIGEFLKIGTAPEIRHEVLYGITSHAGDGRLIAYWALSDWPYFHKRVSRRHFHTIQNLATHYQPEAIVAGTIYEFLYTTHSASGIYQPLESIKQSISYIVNMKKENRTPAEAMLAIIPISLANMEHREPCLETLTERYPWKELKSESWWPEINREIQSRTLKHLDLSQRITALILNQASQEI